MPEKGIIPVILDGDPGHDDAIAWTIANASEKIRILAVTTAAGNQTIEKTTYNALRICALTGIDAPVAKGCPRPLMTEPMNAPSVHGETGLDGPALPEPVSAPADMPAADLWAKVIMESDVPVTIVSTGPLTNTAAFLYAYPELKERIERISLMGGGLRFGNWTPAAEFNILVDPEAARTVFESGIPILMSGLDVTEKALIFPGDFERIRALGNPVSDIVWQWLEFFYRFHRTIGYEGAPMHDPCAVMALLHPEIFEMHEYHVEIETSGDFCRGMTVPDFMGTTGKAPNAICITGVDRQAFADYLVEAVAHYGEMKR